MVKLAKLGSLISRVFSSFRRFGASVGAPRPRPALQPVRVVNRKEKGQALIEFAFVLPLFLVFMVLIVDFGLAIDKRQTIQHDVREGARAGAVGASESEIKAAAGEIPGVFDISVCYVDKDGNGIPGNAGDSVRVSGEYVYRFTIGSGELLAFFGTGAPSMTMTPSADSRLETTVTGANACP